MSSWRSSPYHRQWLLQRSEELFAFFQKPSLNPDGGFYSLDSHRLPLQGPCIRELFATCRMVHCFVLGELLGQPGSMEIVDHGMRYLWEKHRDQQHGGYFWSLNDDGVVDARKQAYGHAFVLLAASSAKTIGHPLANALLTDVTEVLERHFWLPDYGLCSEEYNADWSEISSYRGQNSNMHLTEALMAAFEVTSDQDYLTKAHSIAEFLIHRTTSVNHWRLPEHFHRDWRVDLPYEGDPMFRPAGSTPGHWLEWARLLTQLWHLEGKRHSWMPDAARRMFQMSVSEGWDRDKSGFYYTLDWNGKPLIADRLWWPLCEGLGAAAYLYDIEREDFYEQWYRRIWGFVNAHVLERPLGSWQPQLDADLRPRKDVFKGRPDIYHALQACLIPLYPTTVSLTKAISEKG